MNTLGKQGEEIAVKFLKKKGYTIIQKNFKTSLGEIDIIARDGDKIVFVEVKTRADDMFGHPFEAVGHKKKEKIRKTALCFMKRLKRESPARFDVLGIYVREGKEHVEHMIDAFE